MADKFTKDITMRLMRGKITYDQAQKALTDPAAFKAEEKRQSLLLNREDGKPWPGRYHWWGKIKTSRRVVAYCWCVKRNRAGYFVGWKEIYDAAGGLKREQFVARKTKWRLSELQKRKTDALIKKGASPIRH